MDLEDEDRTVDPTVVVQTPLGANIVPSVFAIMYALGDATISVDTKRHDWSETNISVWMVPGTFDDYDSWRNA